ncbi:DNA methylase, partial [human gut metagenome]
AIVDGQVYYRENSRMVRPDLNATAEARVKGLVGLRDCVQELIDLQMDAAVPGQHHYPKTGGTEPAL